MKIKYTFLFQIIYSEHLIYFACQKSHIALEPNKSDPFEHDKVKPIARWGRNGDEKPHVSMCHMVLIKMYTLTKAMLLKYQL